ncbi:hypothetical protein [Streptacidiphilus monticola]|uniref:Resolvase n=1 Tax=Streptacidiphilus monticola TaxID=2161674 RepID=A0ABW1FXI1_9ACTN
MDDDTTLRTHAAALREQGLTRRQIMDRLGIDSKYRLNRLLQWEIPPDCPRRARAKDAERERARELRRAGWTYSQIQKELRISQASISLWVADLPKPPPRLSPAEQARHANEVRWEPYRRERDRQRREVLEQAAREAADLTERELLMVGAALYWAEGSKSKPHRRAERAVFINSDPGVIRVYLAWLDLIGVARSELTFRVHIHETADAESAQRFWAQVVDAGAEQFARPTLKRHNPRTVRKNTGEGYHGCLVIDVRRSADLYRRIEGWWYGIVGAATKQSAVG